jgi:hypothetical protein
MTTARREYFLLIVGLILVVVTGAAVYYIQKAPNRSRDMAQVTKLVTDFGQYEKSISLQEDAELLKSDIQQNYSQFVTDTLLQQWRSAPATAPGRQTSSPWPDRIEIDSVTPQGSGYIVSGRVVMLTSAGESASTPVILQVIQDNGSWKIAAYQEQKVAQK